MKVQIMDNLTKAFSEVPIDRWLGMRISLFELSVLCPNALPVVLSMMQECVKAAPAVIEPESDLNEIPSAKNVVPMKPRQNEEAPEPTDSKSPGVDDGLFPSESTEEKKRGRGRPKKAEPKAKVEDDDFDFGDEPKEGSSTTLGDDDDFVFGDAPDAPGDSLPDDDDSGEAGDDDDDFDWDFDDEK